MTVDLRTEGSARPEGGCEAPAVEPKVRLRRNGGGSGAARCFTPGGAFELRIVPCLTRDLWPDHEAPDQVRGRVVRLVVEAPDQVRGREK